MKVQAMRCLVGLMAWAALAGQVMAQDAGTGGAARVSDLPPSPTDPVYGPTSQPIDSSQLQGGQVYQPMAVDQIFTPAFRVDARGGNLYGYNGGFTNVGAYAPYLVDPNTLLFIDGRGLITDYSRGGANVGVGWRFYDEDFDRVWGLNAWYDHDGGHARKYNQVGVGFESLGRYFDMRLNGYLPIGNDSNVLSSTPDANSLGFSQQFITFLQRNTIENAYTGFDSEIGGPFPILGRYGMSGYVGFYFFTNSTGGDFTGVSGRFNQRINEDLQLSVQLTHDHKFGSNAQIQVIAQIPNGWPSKWLRQKRVYDRLADPVFRNYRVIAGQDVVSKTERLVNPIDGQPYFVAHVDPNLTAAGNGNIETPFNSLAGFNDLAGPLKSQYDLVYVRPRNDNTSTNLDTGIQLLDRQRLLSANGINRVASTTAPGGFTAQAHTIVGRNDSGGPLAQFNLPIITRYGSNNPLLRNIGVGPTDPFGNRSVVTIASRNEVSGFTIDGTPGPAVAASTLHYGIASGSGTIDSFDINRNIFNKTLDAVRIESADTLGLGLAGPAIGVLENNLVVGRGFDSNTGFFVNHSGGQLNLRAANNSVRADFVDVPGEPRRAVADTGILGEDRNRNGMLDPTEDINGNSVLDPGEDLNANGQLDLAEDNDNDSQLDIGIAMDFRATGAGTVVNAVGTSAGFDYKSFSDTIPGPANITLGILDNPLVAPNQPVPDVGGNGNGISLGAFSNALFTADVRNNRLTGNVYYNPLDTGPRGFGFRGLATGGSLRLNTFSGNDMSNNCQDGAQLFATGGGSIQVLGTINNQNFNNNGVRNNPSLTATTPPVRSLIGGDGLSILAEGGSTVTLRGITDSQFNSNTNDGLKLVTRTNGEIRIAERLTGNFFGDGTSVDADPTNAVNPANLGNLGNGLEAIANSGVITVNIGNNAINNAGTLVPATATTGSNSFLANGDQATGIGNGIRMEVTQNGAIFTSLRGNRITESAGSGVVFNLDTPAAPRSGRIVVDDITGNFISNNGNATASSLTTGNGMEILNGNGGEFTTNGLISNNFSNNRRAELFLGGHSGSATSFNNINTVNGNNFNRRLLATGVARGTEGILFDTLNTFTTMNLANNTFEVDPPAGTTPPAPPLPPLPSSSRPGRGIGGEVNGGGLTLNLLGQNIGKPTTTANTFTNNGDAHIGLVLSGNSVNQINIEGHTFNNVVNSTNPLETQFQGDGLGFIVEDSAQLTGFIRSSEINNNVRNGIRMQVRGNSVTEVARIENFQIGGATAAQGNTINLNLSDGISIERFDGGRVIDAVIGTNTIERNGDEPPAATDPANPTLPAVQGTGNGIFLSAANSNSQDNYNIFGNSISRNAENGVLLRVEADARLLANIDDNVISNNGQDGIQTEERVNDLTDQRGISGNWTRNNVDNNGRDGIRLAALSNGLVIGNAGTDRKFSTISGNRQNGINVIGAGSLTVVNNTITQNGAADGTTLGTAAETAGIKASQIQPLSNISIVGNDISDNFGDGIEHGIQAGQSRLGDLSNPDAVLNVQGNRIDSNLGRGLDLVNRGSIITRSTITGNVINRNGREGIYLVNTASNTQNQFSTVALAALAQDGAFDANPVYEALISGNQVISNGNTSTNNVTGLLVRVGTSGGSTTFPDAGGFASNGAANAIGSSTGRGGVSMAVTGNTFGGTRGQDVRFQSFVSTVNPTQTAGTWDNTTFNVTSIQNDPLARLDLRFTGNVLQAADVNNQTGISTGTNQGVAFYNNDEGTFKSRVSDNDAATIQDGPFSSAARRRNAQRQAARIPGLNAPVPGNDGGTFLYSGIGDSTFRVNTDTVGLFTIDAVVPNTNIGQQNGFNFGNPILGEQPFGWGSF